jgi:hypothetical protein
MKPDFYADYVEELQKSELVPVGFAGPLITTADLSGLSDAFRSPGALHTKSETEAWDGCSGLTSFFKNSIFRKHNDFPPSRSKCGSKT